MCQEPFTQMVHKYQNLVFSICVKMTGDYFAAEDLTQETFLSAYRHKEEFDGKNEKAWLCRIASNKCIDYSRQAARRMVPTEDEVLGSHPARAGGPEEQCIEEVVREELQEKCGQLKPPYDEIAKLYFCEEHPAGEIAELKQKNLKTVQTQIYRARAMLRKLYGKERSCMRKEDIQEYLSDEALEALIRETEEGPMIKAPEYLEENILHKIEQQQKVIVYKEKVSAKRKLLTYSMKVMVAAAAAIAFLVVVPTVEQQSRPNMETYVAEAKEQVNKDLQEQKEKAKKRSEEQNFLQSVNDASSAFCNFITETTNGWFLKEER